MATSGLDGGMMGTAPDGTVPSAGIESKPTVVAGQGITHEVVNSGNNNPSENGLGPQSGNK